MERYQKGSFVQSNRRGKSNAAGANGNAQSLRVGQNGMLVGLPKVPKNKAEDFNNSRGLELSPARNSGYNNMGSHNDIGSLKMPSLVDRNGLSPSMVPGNGLPSLPRHQQQRYPLGTEFQQAYQNKAGKYSLLAKHGEL